MAETSEAAALPITQESNKLVEKIGKANLGKLAVVGLALSALFGVAEKVNSGASIGVEVMDPVTGGQKTVGVGISLTKAATMGIPQPDARNAWYDKGLDTYEVEVNGTRFYVYTAGASRGEFSDNMKTLVAIRPGFETAIGK